MAPWPPVATSSDDLGWRRPNPVGVAAVITLAALLPIVWPNDYVIDVALTALIWMILNQSWNLQLGIGGIWNFGQLAIFAIGAYVVRARQHPLGRARGGWRC